MSEPVDILFDARHLRSSGIGSYTKTCLQALGRLTEEDGLKCSVIVRENDIQALPANLGGPIRVSDARMYTPQEQLMWHRSLAAVKPRLAWFPHYPVPILARRQKKHRDDL